MSISLASPLWTTVLHSGATAWSPEQLPSLAAWYRGDDAGASITASEYDSIPNRGSAGGSFAFAGAKPDVVTLNGKSAPDFASTERLQYSGAAADFSFLHDDTGSGTITLRCHNLAGGAHTLLCTTRSGQTGNGGVWLYRPSTTSFQLRVVRSTGVDDGYGNSQHCEIGDVITITKSPTSVVTYVNGEQQLTAALTTPSSGAPKFALVVGNTETGGAPINGTIPELMLQSTIDTASMDRRINWLHSRWSSAPNIVVAGNSLTVGGGSSFSPSKNWLRQMNASALGYPMLRRIATSGVVTPTLTSEILTRAMPKFIGNGSDMLIIYEAGNDMLYGASPAAAWANIVAYRNAAVAAGWSGAIATCTIGPRSDLDTATEVNAFNTLARANWEAAGFAFLADFGDDAGLAVPAADGIHYNDAQYLIIAGYFEAEILAYFAGPTFSSAAVDESGYRVTLTYSEALDEDYTPAASDFSVGGTGVNGVPVNGSVVVSGATVRFDLSLPVGDTRTVTVSYTPGATTLRKAAAPGASAGALVGGAVTNNSLLVAAYDLAFGVTHAAGLISQIDDASGEGNHITQATSARRRQYNATGLGGRPTADSNDTVRHLLLTALTGGAVSQPTWIMHATTWSTTAGRICDGYDAGVGRHIMSGNGTNAQIYSGAFAGSAGQPSNGAATIFDAEMNSPNSRLRIEPDGASIIEQTGLTTGTQTLIGFQMGGGVGTSWRGNIGRTLVYRGPVSAGAKEVARQRAREDFSIEGL